MIPKKIAIKIKYGYGVSDFVVVDNFEDAAKAMYAKIEKIPVTLKGRMISGQEIKTIEVDVHSYTGWNRGYLPTSPDDFAQIERDVPEVVEEMLQAVGQQVNKAIELQDPSLLNSAALSAPHLVNQISSGEEKPLELGEDTTKEN